jgi:hexosaminidase
MVNLIPAINGEFIGREGTLVFPKLFTVDAKYPTANKVFAQRLTRLGDYELKEGPQPLIMSVDEQLAKEGYRLEISPERVIIYSSGERGYSLGLISLYQLLAKGNGKVECCTFSDIPRYPRRGFMLDVCRHFFSVEQIKKVIEQCSLLKLNYFHWHLSEDQGFRIESKKFPKLNEISSYRKLSAIDPIVTRGMGKEGDKYGGYYTQEEIKEIVAYAAERQIEVIPEIDLPGHSSAILAAFPEYTCSGEPLEVVNTFGIFPRIFCAGKEESYNFLYELLDEVLELFPSKYFHLGGDEAPKNEWKKCDDCKRVMQQQGFSNYEQLQAHFTEKLITYLIKKGKTPIVWNDATASGQLDKNAIVQYWLEMAPGESYVLPEVEKGREFIMSSLNNFYFDYSYAEIPMKATLLYEPEIKGTPIPESSVLGVEAPLWAEWVPTDSDVDRMIYPRLHALAECGWTREKDYDSFLERLKEYLQVEALNILQGSKWEEATIHGQAALDIIVEKVIELSQRYRKIREESDAILDFQPDGTEQVQVDPLESMKSFIYDKMKAAYSEEEIKYVQDCILKGQK